MKRRIGRGGDIRRAPKPPNVRAARGEQVCLVSRPHGVVLAQPLARALVAGVLGVFLLTRGWPLVVAGAVLLALAAAVALRAVWRWERTRVIVTSENVVVTHGTVRRRTASVPVRSLGALELEQTLPGRLLGYGTLVAGPLEIDHVPQPRRVCELLTRLAA